MLKEDWKQNLVLVVFCIFLREVLTGTTLVFVALGLLLVLLGKRPNKYVRNALALGVFGSYWFKYGKIIDPEIGLNFLTSIITLKILEKETVRDRYMIFFGLLLLISAGSLFERTISYVIFFTGSFLVLIDSFYSYLGRRWSIKDFGVAIVWVFPFTFLLFFLVPRLLNPIPFQQNTMGKGEIGYTADVNISEIESLQSNTSPVFQVMTSRELSSRELYWRGNILSYNDGWNWKENIQDKAPAEIIHGHDENTTEIKQTFRIFIRPEYFFGLNYPSEVVYGNDTHKLNPGMRTLPQRRWDWVQRYEVYSDPNSLPEELGREKTYLHVPLSKVEKEKIRSAFSGNNVEEVTASVKEYFRKNNFVYSLSPGRSISLSNFLERKSGFCSHYASTLAIVLRLKGIPSRLVSGFMGGSYNKFANFYLVTQNDAHVWVEAHDGNQWVKMDPTEWIAPDRVRLGGEAFVESVSTNPITRKGFLKLPGFFNDLKMWFGQWDFLFYQWLEQMDYYTQDAIFMKFKFKRQWLFSVIPLVMVFFMLIYTWYLATRKDKNENFPQLELWDLFILKMRKKGVEISRIKITDSMNVMNSLQDPAAKEIFHELVAWSFQNKESSFKEIRKKIKSL